MMTEIKASVNPDPIFGYWDVFLWIYRPLALCWYIGGGVFIHLACFELVDSVECDPILGWERIIQKLCHKNRDQDPVYSKGK